MAETFQEDKMIKTMEFLSQNPTAPRRLDKLEKLAAVDTAVKRNRGKINLVVNENHSHVDSAIFTAYADV